MMNKVTDYNNLEEWFCKVANNEIKPSLVHLIGDVGVGKKTDVRNIIQEYGYRCININCIYDKDHSRFKKKTFVFWSNFHQLRKTLIKKTLTLK